MRVRVIESVGRYGHECLAVQFKGLLFWSTVRRFPLEKKKQAIELARMLAEPRVLFDSKADAGGA